MDNQIPRIIGMFPDRETAELAYEALVARGYARSDINILMSEETKNRYFMHTGPTTELGSKAGEGAGVGGAIGGTVGAIAAAIAAIGTTLLLPGLGLVVAGPLAAAIAGAGAGAATGGIVGLLVGWTIPEERVKEYDQGVRRGGILISVQPRTKADAAYLEEKWKLHHAQAVYH